MSLFAKKKEEVCTDREELLKLMQQLIDTKDFKSIDTSSIKDRELASKFEKVIETVIDTNNVTVMKLNNSMKRIGDSSVVKDMIEQVNMQTTEINMMKDNSETLGDTVENVMKLIQEIQNNTNDVIETAQSSTTELEGSMELIDQSSNLVNGVNDRIKDFKTKAAVIRDIISDIKKVANRSGMLALNASIEAARAGEAGKGFAVVAEQVRDLSANTTVSAENIETYMKELLEEIDELGGDIQTTTLKMQQGNESVHHSIESIGRVDDAIEAIRGEINTIYNEINTQSALTESFIATTETMAESYNTLAKECMNTGTHMYKISREVDQIRSDLARGNSRISDLDWITVYEIDHLIFTWRIYNNLAGFESLRLEQVNNNKGCKFGKWIATHQNEAIGKTDDFKKAVSLHDNLHKYATASWEAMNNGDRATALAQFELASSEYQNLIKVFEKLRKYIRSSVSDKETKIN